MRYVALGDSYTIGTAVPATERWPERLAAALGPPAEPALDLVANLAVNGATSGDLIRDQLPALERLRPDIVSVLIGVNDVVRGVAPAGYEANLERILGTLLGHVAPDRVFAVAIPDYTVSPSGSDYGDPVRQHAAIVAANAAMARRCRAAGIAYVDTFDLSLRAAVDRALIAHDGLHPSGAQYGLWLERIVPVVAGLLGR
jgi:acyl-CoA thioesterase-1